MGYKFLNSGAAAELHIFNDIGWIGTTADQFKSDLQAVGTKPLLVHINSKGGDPVDAQAIYNLLAGRKNTTTRTMMAASAASIIAQAGTPRQIVNNGWMMIHEPIVASASGNESAMRAAAEGLSSIKLGMAQTYATRSGKSIEEVQALMAAETWYTGQQAVDAGFADEVVDSMAMAASATLDAAALANFKHTPPQVLATLGLTPAAPNKEDNFMPTPETPNSFKAEFAEWLKSFKPGPSEREQRLMKILAQAKVDPDELLKKDNDDALSQVIESIKAEAIGKEKTQRENVQASLNAVVAALVSAGVPVDLTKPEEVAETTKARIDSIASHKLVTLAASRGIAPQATAPGAMNGATTKPKDYTEQCLEAIAARG